PRGGRAVAPEGARGTAGAPQSVGLPRGDRPDPPGDPRRDPLGARRATRIRPPRPAGRGGGGGALAGGVLAGGARKPEGVPGDRARERPPAGRGPVPEARR